MADVFLSYAREDRAKAEQVARGLEAAGVSVFWDTEIPPGQTWADYIESKLRQCSALIVLWSENSTKSQWVREEARLGRDKGVLIPAMIDHSLAPFGFGEVQAANLADWHGESDHADWRRFMEAVRAAAGREAPVSPPPRVQPAMSMPRASSSASSTSSSPAKKGVPGWAWALGGVVATFVVLIIIGLNVPQQPTPAPQPASVQPQPQPAGATNYQQQILMKLAQVEQAVASEGFQRIDQPVTGQLPQGQTQAWPATLNAGVEYRIIGVCDDDCNDLDLLLYDENNVLVSEDQSTNAMAMVSVAPQWTGPFQVQALMYNCTVAPCYYAIVLYGRAR